MRVMGKGYGSEWHLRLLLATNPERIGNEVLSVLTAHGLSSVHGVVWHPVYLERGVPELRGLDFLESDSPVRQEWLNWWPQTGNVQNWDAVATIRQYGGAKEWLLVEAKANLREVHSDCKAKEHGGLPLIRSRLRETQLACGITGERNWTKGHYQYANRLALLHFLQSRGVAARLVFVCFIGDQGDERRDCPKSRAAWDAKLAEMKACLGLSGQSDLEKRVHEVFLCVTAGGVSCTGGLSDG